MSRLTVAPVCRSICGNLRPRKNAGDIHALEDLGITAIDCEFERHVNAALQTGRIAGNLLVQ
jgi:hypothetical protein